MPQQLARLAGRVAFIAGVVERALILTSWNRGLGFLMYCNRSSEIAVRAEQVPYCMALGYTKSMCAAAMTGAHLQAGELKLGLGTPVQTRLLLRNFIEVTL